MKLQSINPHDQSIVGQIDVSSEKEVKQAVEKARNAFNLWRDLSISDRVAFIKKIQTSVSCP